MIIEPPQISIIIPARDEEKYLPWCLRAIYEAVACAGCTVEIIVVLNRCTDFTEAIALDAGAKIVKEDAKNLAKIRNAGAAHAAAPILVFIDADSRMHRLTLRSIQQKIADPTVVGGGVMMFPERYSWGIVLTMACLLPFVIIDRISGGLFFVRKKDFEAIHGFDETFLTVEDIDFARRLKIHGKHSHRKFITLWLNYIITSTRKFDRFGDWYFLLHPREFLMLFKGRNKTLADKVWYNFKR